MEGAWSCYIGQYNGGRMVMLRRCQFNGGRMVMLQRYPVIEGACSCYSGGQFKGGKMVMLPGLSL